MLIEGVAGQPGKSDVTCHCCHQTYVTPVFFSSSPATVVYDVD